MPKIVFFQEEDGRVPILDWMDALPLKVLDKCTIRLERLEQQGHELHRPEADYLRDGIYELRVRHQSVNYRMLYFFFGRTIIVVSHGFTKERAVPPAEIERALDRKRKFELAPHKYGYEE
ncbi:MAG: type II toxin-antitoxin system RelE/ParE family toxin [bacterium]|nr:type II toxin-antitoxin system RelE/ParE family toxin [bacterium]